ncbi:MAG: GNAT family N-acetyltransferase [Aeromicrobium sp.]|uniref:GNAT family N-acetyltransferase n=1 Tax=Aeromicrobium sp. TaxID=1871063 RepID=UPI003C5AE10C
MIFSSPDPAADPYVALALLELQRASYAVEAELIGDDRIPPLRQNEVDLTSFRGHWLLAWNGVDLVGAAAWVERESGVEIDKVMVRPTAHRQGVGSQLLALVIEAAADRQIAVATGRDNAPARALYGKYGFADVRDERVPPGIWITRLQRASVLLEPDC